MTVGVFKLATPVRFELTGAKPNEIAGDFILTLTLTPSSTIIFVRY